VDPLFAGNVVQLTIVLGISLGYISTYVFRVANKVRRTDACSSARRSPPAFTQQRSTVPRTVRVPWRECSARHIARDTASGTMRADCVPRQQMCSPALLQAV